MHAARARARECRAPEPCLLAGDGTLRCMSDESTALPTVIEGTWRCTAQTPARGWEPDHVEQLGEGLSIGVFRAEQSAAPPKPDESSAAQPSDVPSPPSPPPSPVASWSVYARSPAVPADDPTPRPDADV